MIDSLHRSAFNLHHLHTNGGGDQGLWRLVDHHTRTPMANKSLRVPAPRTLTWAHLLTANGVGDTRLHLGLGHLGLALRVPTGYPDQRKHLNATRTKRTPVIVVAREGLNTGTPSLLPVHLLLGQSKPSRTRAPYQGPGASIQSGMLCRGKPRDPPQILRKTIPITRLLETTKTRTRTNTGAL